MIRITLNLARHPAENLRRVRVLWGGALALLAALLVVLASIAALSWWRSRPIQVRIDAVQVQMAPIQARQDELRDPLSDPNVRNVIDQAAFFNQLIDRKSVSWTLLFERLEKIMPPEVELVSLRPLVRDGQNAVDIRFASNTEPPAIEFMKALETNPDFTGAWEERSTEADPAAPGAAVKADPPPRFEFEVSVLYRGGQ